MPIKPKRFHASIMLDMEPEDFELVRENFLVDLADILGFEESEIQITKVIHHCSDVYFEVPEDRGGLVQLINDRNSPLPEELRKKIANFRRKYKVMMKLDKAPAFSKRLMFIPDPPKKSLTWIQLSDSHFEGKTSGKKTDFWGQNKVAEAFLNDLPELLNEEHLDPDLVFFTGDVSFSGKPEEFEIAQSFTQSLHEKLPSGNRAKFFFIPGNHDVDRDVVSRFHREEQDALTRLTKNDTVFSYLGSPKYQDDRDRILARLDNFWNFSNSVIAFGQPEINHDFFYCHSFEHRGVKLGIAGLNSAWRCSSEKDRGNLILGAPQLDKAIKELSDSQLKILLMHHPAESDWFIAEDRIYQRNYLPNFDFVLRGHEHDPDSQIRGFFNGQQYCQISAGALYSHEDFHKSFNAVQIDLETGAAWVFFWRLSEKTYRWIKDVEIYKNGFHAFELPEETIDRLTNPDIAVEDPDYDNRDEVDP